MFVMARVICFAMTKGGVGKSTLSVELTTYLDGLGHKVVFINADPQSTSTNWLRKMETGVLSETLQGQRPDARNKQFRELINKHSDQADFIVIDTQGAATVETSTAITRSDLVIIPMQPSQNDIDELAGTFAMIQSAQDVRGGKPKAVIALNFTSDRDVLAPQIRRIAVDLGITVARTSISRLNSIRDGHANATTTIRSTDRTALAAGNRLRRLFDEILHEHLEFNQDEAKGVGNG